MKTQRSGQAARLLVLVLLAALLAACNSLGAGSEPTPDPNVGGGRMPTATQPAAQPPATQPPADEPTTPPSPTEAGAAADPGPETTPTEAVPSAAEPTAGEPAAGEPPASAESVTAFPDPNGFTWQPVITGLARPLDLAAPPDGSGRLVILEQPGIIRVFQDGSLVPEPFLDIQDRINSSGNEQGLLGIAFHPNYSENRYFYVNYTDVNGDTVIARFTASADNANTADPGSEHILLRVDQPYPNHNGGGMVFGPDGLLYMSLGDGGSGGDPQGNAQSLQTHLGKLLRVDVDGGDPYAIPADNPFAGGGGLPEIWAYGLRNPWRFSFDRATGDLYIADVGQNAWEEIDFLPAGSPGGANFGWDYLEGSHPYEGGPPAGVDVINPIYEYQHPVGCSVTGGYVYRGQELPEFNGIYLFSDYCTGIVWGLLRGADGGWQSQELFRTGLFVSSFGEDASGEIYLIDQGAGSILRLQRQ